MRETAIPDEVAVRAAATDYMKGWALFRSPDAPGGATELVPSEYEDVVRRCVTAYLRALQPIMRCPNCDGPLDAEGFHASEWAACDWVEPIPESERVPDDDGSPASETPR